MKNMKNQFKVTITDRKTGDKTSFLVDAMGFRMGIKRRLEKISTDVMVDNGIEVVRLVLDFPKMKVKRGKNGE